MEKETMGFVNEEDKSNNEKMEEARRAFPSLKGVLPPMLRIDINNLGIESGDEATVEQVKNATEAIKKFTADFGYKGSYHTNVEPNNHHREVGERLAGWVSDLGLRLSANEKAAVALFADGHDAVHNAGRSPENKFTMTLRQLGEYYDIASTDDLEALKEALNIGYVEDNNRRVNPGSAADRKEPERPLVENFDMPLVLSDEEASNIIVDSIARKAGLPVDVRAISYGMIESTEFSRSMAGGNLGTKIPRTQLELAAKLADMGNWEKEVSDWLKTSVRVNIEAPWFNQSTVDGYCNGELGFFNFFAGPVMKAENIPEGAVISERSQAGFDKVVSFLNTIKGEIAALKADGSIADDGTLAVDPDSIGGDLRQFMEIVAPVVNGKRTDFPATASINDITKLCLVDGKA